MRGSYPSRLTLLWILIAATSPLSAQEAFRFSVFGLFAPTDLAVRPVSGGVLSLRAGDNSLVLEASQSARLMFEEGAIRCETAGETVRATRVSITGRGGPAQLQLEVPGRIERQFRGSVDVFVAGDSLVAVVSMDSETAVASIVAAESLPGTPLEALRTQAVATRSYLRAAKGRHRDFDFCDTTHCQYLRAPPPPEHLAWRAAASHRLRTCAGAPARADRRWPGPGSSPRPRPGTSGASAPAAPGAGRRPRRWR